MFSNPKVLNKSKSTCNMLILRTILCAFWQAGVAGEHKKAPAEAGAKCMRQVSYRQETYRAVKLSIDISSLVAILYFLF